MDIRYILIIIVVVSLISLIAAKWHKRYSFKNLYESYTCDLSTFLKEDYSQPYQVPALAFDLKEQKLYDIFILFSPKPEGARMYEELVPIAEKGIFVDYKFKVLEPNSLYLVTLYLQEEPYEDPIELITRIKLK